MAQPVIKRLFIPFTGGLLALVALGFLMVGGLSAAPPPGVTAPPGLDPGPLAALQQAAAAQGSVPVIVGFAPAGGFRPEGLLAKAAARAAQQAAIKVVQERVLERLSGLYTSNVKRFGHIPFVALHVDARALDALSRMPEVSSIEEDRRVTTSLPQSVPLIGGDVAWQNGYSGLGQTVAILDTGVDKFHSFLSGKVVSEACSSTTASGSTSSGTWYSTTVCPNGQSSQTGTGAGIYCPLSIYSCDHGTHVSGIAAGKDGTVNGQTFSGVARDADLIAIQIFSKFTGGGVCGSFPDPCAQAFDSDIIWGLDRVSTLSGSFSIAAVNMSLGGGSYTSTAKCDSDSPSTKAAIDNLRSLGIATVVAAGNSGTANALSYPACISSAISVGATTKQDAIASYSNSASFLDLLAPGSSIYSSVPGGGFATWSGTSMATPHVTGAWAVLKQHEPSASVDQILSDLETNGKPILDSRNGITKPRIQIDAVPGIVGAAPLAIGTTRLPGGVVGQSYSQTLTASGGSAPYSWSVVGSLPAGLALDGGTGKIYGTPTVEGASSFSVEVTDNAGTTASQALSITIDPAPVGQASLIISTDNANQVYFNGALIGSADNWKQASSYTLALQSGANVVAVKGMDTGGIAALIAELTLPDGSKVVSDGSWKVSTALQTGWQAVVFDDSGWVGASSYGVYGVSPWAKNVAGFPSSSTASWIWSSNNDADNTVYVRYSFYDGTPPLAIGTTSLPGGVVGQSYSQTLTASGGSAPYSWSVVGSLPAGLALDGGTGKIYGTPTVEGTSSFSVEVTDNAGTTASQALSITIDPAPVGQASLIISTDNANQVYFNGALIGSADNWKQASSYTLGLQAGVNVVAVKGMDAGGIAALIAELTLPDGSKVVSDGSWKVSTALQTGWQAVVFDDSGWVGASSYGVYGVSPWAKNVAGFPSSSTASWIWSSNNDADNTVYVRYSFYDGTPPLAIGTTSLPGGVVGQSYSQTLTASGGSAPYSWSVVGSLPAGLALDGGTGKIYGTPTVEGASSFSVEVTDNAGTTASQALSITIDPAPVGQASLIISTDNANQVYFNGALIGSADNWKQASSYTLALQSGANVVAVKGMDTGGIAALIAELTLPDGSKVVSDGSWKVSTALQTGWQAVVFDDSGWVGASSYGVYGVSPWAKNVAGFPSSSTASWIWSSNNDADDTVYLRYKILVP